MGNYIKNISLIIFLISIFFCFSGKNENNKFNNLINNYYIPLQKDIIKIPEDEFISGKISDNSLTFYQFKILNDAEQIFFDYQSEFGCLYINAYKNTSINQTTYHFQFCSKGENNIFSLNKKEILETIDVEEDDSIADINLIIGVGNPFLETYNFGFSYTLKVSLKKPEINILKINSDNKILCKTEQINGKNYRCLFMILNNFVDEGSNFIIYPISKNNEEKLNIYANYINNTEYDDWNIEYLSNNIPNENSEYNNADKDMNYIIIPKVKKDKYIYLSIESNTEITIEMLYKLIRTESQMPNVDDIYIYYVNNKTEINFAFNKIYIQQFTLHLVTIHGKGNITFGYKDYSQYIIDEIHNKLLFDINLTKYIDNNYKLLVNNTEEDGEFIFYFYYSEKGNNKLKELEYGKSNNIMVDTINQPLIIFQKIKDITTSVNINLQIYRLNNIYDTSSDIRIIVLSKYDIYRLKVNPNIISYYTILEEGKFDTALLTSNIYLNIKNIENIDTIEEPYLLIYVTFNINSQTNSGQIIFGATISQVNGLMYSSERIYHYGKLYNEEKVVYRLKGNPKYHLMRLELGFNNKNIEWSVKRKKDNIYYRKNDTDLSFVTEKWINGRELLTMYIENGEDIYLTLFHDNSIDNPNITNFVFKYINSGKNGDFKNYYIKSDSLSYNKKDYTITINKLTNLPESSKVKYYLKLIKESDLIKNEIINTIAITESNNILVAGPYHTKNKAIFYLETMIDSDISYYINAYSIVTDNNNNNEDEYISYSNIRILKNPIKVIKVKTGFIIGSISVAGSIFLLLIIRCICYYIVKKDRAYDYNYNYRLRESYLI